MIKEKNHQMKKIVRLLSVLLCGALLMTGIPAAELGWSVRAEEMEPEMIVVSPAPETAELTAKVTNEASPAPTIAPSAEATAEPTAEATAEPSTEHSTEPGAEPTVQITAAPTAKPEIDYGKNAGESPLFACGYVEILSADMPVYASADGREAAAWLGRGVAYAVARSASEPDRLLIAYNPDPADGVRSEWVDAKGLRPMDPAAGGEVEKYIASCAGDEKLLFYNGDREIPLKKIDCRYPELLSARLKADSAVIGVGDSSFRLEVIYSDGVERAALYKSSSSRVASVDENGVVTGVRKGTAVIAVRTELGDFRCEITVKAAPKKIGVSPASGEMAVGEQMQLKPLFASDCGGSVRFESSDESVASVDESGLVTAHAKGDAQIYVYSYNLANKPAVAQISVLGAATQISFHEESMKLALGMQAQLSVNFLPNERDSVRFSAAESGAVSVSADGVVQARRLGSAVVTATAGSGAQAQCEIRVLPAPTEGEIDLIDDSLKIGQGEKYDLKRMIAVADGCCAQFSFESSKTKCAVVDEDGVVTGMRKGSAVIRISTQNGIVLGVRVEVCASPSSVSFEEKKLTLAEGSSYATKLIFKSSGSYCRCSYASSNEEVASVDENGVITAHRAGQAVITARTAQGKSGSCAVLVKKQPESIGVEKAQITMGVGEPGRFVAGIHDEDSLCSFNYISKNPEVARVNIATGELTALSCGTTEITVRASSGATASCSVTVLQAPRTLILSAASLQLGVGESYDGLIASVDEGAAASVVFASSSSRTVKVEDGVLVGLRRGSAIVTAKTYNGLTAACRVTVCSAPSKIAFEQSAIRIGCQDRMQLQLKFSPSGSYAQAKYDSSDEGIVRVDEKSGEITAVSVGTAQIRAQLKNGRSAICSVTVLPAPEAISAAESYLRISVGESGRTVRGLCPAGAMCSFSYASSDEKIVQVNAETGELTALSRGSAEIIIRAHSGAEARCKVEVADAPTELNLSCTSLRLTVGERFDGISGTVDGGASAALRYKSSNERIVKVNENGVVTGLKKGIATVSAATYNGIVAKCKVTVCEAPRAIAFEASSLRIGVGESTETGIRMKPGNAYSAIRYESSDENIAVIDPDSGIVTGVNAGTALLRAMTINGKQAMCSVTVCPAPVSVSFDPEALSLSEGMSAQLTPVLSPLSCGSYTIISSNPTVASVDGEGNVKALSAGKCVIRATTYNNFSAECAVTVTKAPAELKFAFSELTMLKGDVISLPEPAAYDADGNECSASFSYTSSDSKIAVIDANGSIRALREGKSRITARSYNNVKAYFVLNVSAEVVSIELEPASAILYTDGDEYAETLRLRVRNMGSASATLSYASSHPEVATVDASGLVTAVSAGKTQISAIAVNGSYATSEIEVKRLSGSISFEAEELELGVSEQAQLTPILEPGSAGMVSYQSSAPKIASVDASGLVTAKGVGTAYITASLPNGRSAVVQLNVVHAPDGIALAADRLRLAVGESVEFKAQLISSAEHFCERVRYESSNPTVASVDENGKLTARRAGKCVIRATACNGLSDACEVEVVATAAQAKLTFGAAAYSIVCGDAAELDVVLNKDAFERGFSLQCSDESLAVLDGRRVQANALRTGDVTLTLLLNPAEGEAAAQSASCTLHIISMATVELSKEKIELKKGETAELKYRMQPENLIGTFECRVEDTEIAAYDPETGVVTAGETAGETQILFRTHNSVARCTVKVIAARKYRALLIGEYNRSSNKEKNLPFAANNEKLLVSTLDTAQLDGEKYAITSRFSNPDKRSIRSMIYSTFADAGEDDVSLIYVMSHGHNGLTGSGFYGFHFSIAPNYDKANAATYVTSAELMEWISGIKGNVILVVDGCYSGGFIRDNAGALSRAGNISVLTAQTHDKPASFYVGTTEASTVEYLTYALCYGMGYDQLRGKLASLPADRDGDDRVTVKEAFSYASSTTVAIVQDKLGSYTGGKTGMVIPYGYYKGWKQEPQMYIAEGMADLELFGRDGNMF